MARFLQWSDLHREFGTEGRPVLFPMPTEDCPAGSIDAILVAGDISKGVATVETLREIHKAWGVPVLAVRGNHESYSHEFGLCLKSQKEAIHAARVEGLDIRILDREAAVIGDTRILGCTLWTDFDIMGHQEAMMAGSRHMIRDYSCGFRAIGAVISRDRGRLFHGIAGSHFAVAGRLIDGFMESGLKAEVKGFRDFSAHAFA